MQLIAQEDKMDASQYFFFWPSKCKNQNHNTQIGNKIPNFMLQFAVSSIKIEMTRMDIFTDLGDTTLQKAARASEIAK